MDAAASRARVTAGSVIAPRAHAGRGRRCAGGGSRGGGRGGRGPVADGDAGGRASVRGRGARGRGVHLRLGSRLVGRGGAPALRAHGARAPGGPGPRARVGGVPCHR
ncbi:hypothetical protein D7Y23_08470 [Corallococcus sp. AB050B]|nr:hypothetical protein D7Y23_08470 [Corallococcus sp. AB050B]